MATTVPPPCTPGTTCHHQAAPPNDEKGRPPVIVVSRPFRLLHSFSSDFLGKRRRRRNHKKKTRGLQETKFYRAPSRDGDIMQQQVPTRPYRAIKKSLGAHKAMRAADMTKWFSRNNFFFSFFLCITDRTNPRP